MIAVTGLLEAVPGSRAAVWLLGWVVLADVVRVCRAPELPIAPEMLGLPELVDEPPPVREGVACRRVVVVELATPVRASGAGWDDLAGTAAGGDAGLVVVVTPPRG